MEWLGKIPAGWAAKRLKFVAPVRISKLDVKPDDAVYVGLEHIESWTGRLLLADQPESVDSVVASFKAGDVLFGKLRPYLAKVARPDFDGVCTSEILPLRPKVEYSQSYVMYCLLSAPYIRWIDSLTYGTKMPRVGLDQISRSLVPVPPEPDQRAIADFLDRETARIDALIGKKERLIELLEEKRTALITRAVTKGLDPDVPMKDSGVEWLGEIPERWDVTKVEHVAKMESGHTPNRKVKEYWDGGINWLSLSDSALLRRADVVEETTYQISEAGLTNSSARLLPPMTVAFSRDATVGLCALLGQEMAVSQHFIGWVCSGRIHPEYLLLVLKCMEQELDRLTMGATIRTLGLPEVSSLSTPLPSKDEQSRILQHVADAERRIGILLNKVGRAKRRLQEYRSALITAAVTGKIDLRDHAA